MSFKQIRAFHTVYDKKSVTAAANYLNVSQSTITMQVRDLEQHYGTELFLRVGRQLIPTDAAHQLHQITKQLLQAYQESIDFLSSSKALEKGKINFAVVGPFHAAEIASKFKIKHPNIDINLKFGNSQETINSIVNNDGDIGIFAELDAPEGVVTKHYRQQKIVVFVSENHPFYGRKSIKIHELAGQDFIIREQGSTTQRIFQAALDKHKVKTNTILEIGSREGIWKAVSLGLGIAAVADFEFVPSENIQTVQIEDVEIISNYSIAYLKSREGSPIIKAFLSTIFE